MFKTLSAAALSATLAFTCLTPSTAHAADQDDIGRFILGASLLAMIAAAANARSEDDDDDRYVTRSPEREVHHHRHVTKVIRTPTRPLLQPRVREVIRKPSKEVVTRRPVTAHRVIPSQCGRSFRLSTGNRAFFTQSCLEARGIRTSSLPDRCERVLDMPGNRQDRRGWNRHCLKTEGFLIR